MHRRRMHSERAVHVRLISTIVLQAIFSGGLSKPQDALTFSAFFHIVRLLGGQMGVALMGHYIAVRERIHSNLLARWQLAVRGFHSANRDSTPNLPVWLLPRAALSARPAPACGCRRIPSASLMDSISSRGLACIE